MNKTCMPVKNFILMSVLWLFYLVLFIPSLGYSATVSYNYDARHRVIGALFDSGVNVGYSYDDVGNRTQKSLTASANPNNPPNIPSYVYPQENGVDIESENLQLSWNGGDPDPDSIVSYDVYFGDTIDPVLFAQDVNSENLTVPPLAPGIQYYWKVIASDQYGMTSVGETWSFTTNANPPPSPLNPSPENGSVTAYENVYLQWEDMSEPGETLTYDIYLGTTSTPPLVLADSAQNSYQAGTLQPGQTYYWQIVSRDEDNLTTAGPIWTFSTPSHAIQTFTNATFTTDTTLTKIGGPYVVSGQLTVSSGTTLTIEPGAVFKMEQTSSIKVDGTLLAQGTETEKIVFTSSKNDQEGGDTNQDNDATSPSAGDWYGIIINNASSDATIIDHCRVEYAGYGNNAGIKTYNSSPTISNTLLYKNNYYGFYVQNGSPSISNSSVAESGSHGIYVQGGTPTLTSNSVTVSGNYGIYVHSGTPAITGSIIENGVYAPNNGLSTFEGNTLTIDNTHPLHLPAEAIGNLFGSNILVDITAESLVEVVGGTISRDATWKDSIPLKILGSLTVKGIDGEDNLTTLTIDPGAELRFGLYLQLVIGGTSGDPGALMAVGTTEKQIKFTSSAATPAPGNWYGILFSTTAEDSSIMDYCIVEYAGYGGNGGVKTYYSSPTIQNSLIQNNSTYGIYNYYGSPTVSNTTINGNGTYGIYVKGGSPTFSGNTISNSGNYGIYVASGTPVVTGNNVDNGIYTPNNGLSELSGNTLTLDEDNPLRIPADYVGDIFANNTLTNITSESYIEVVGGTISRDATWKDSIPLKILGSLTVKGTDGEDNLTTLTIDPGAELRFGLYLQLVIGGTSGDPGALMSVGTTEKQIKFTSSAATPAPGNWYGILFSTTADDNSVLEQSIVEYAGYGGNGGVKTYYSSPSIQNCIIRKNSTYGIYNYYSSLQLSSNLIADSGTYGIYVRGGSPLFDNNTISDSGNYGIYVVSGTPAITNNNIENGLLTPANGLSQLSGNTITLNDSYPLRVPADFVGEVFSGNTLNNITGNSYMEVVGGTISRDATWKDTLPLKILGSLTVKGTDGVDNLTTLTLDPGAELRFGLYLQFIIGGTSGDPGALMAVGTAENQIRFTSSAATPAPGNWYGILFSTTAEDSSIMDYCIVEYAGYGGNGGVKTYYSSPTIQNSLIQNNSTYGIYNYYGSPTVSNTTINGNGTYGIYVKGGSPTFSGNTISNSGNYGIYVASGTPVVTGNNVDNGIYTPNNGLSELSGNTLTLDEDNPLRIPADYVGDIFANNTLTNITSESYIEVVGGTISRDATWKDSIPLKILGSLTVKGTDGEDNLTTLTIDPGAELRFGLYLQLVIGGTSGDPGALMSVGTTEKQIKFTSSAATPAPGNWYGILFSTTADDNSVLEQSIVEYAGYGGNGGVKTYYSSPSIQNCIIRKNSTYGIYNYYSSLQLSSNLIADSGTYGIYVRGGSPLFDNNTISDSGNYGIYVVSGTPAITNNNIENGLLTPANGLSQLSGNTITLNDSYPLRVPADFVGEVFSGNTLNNITGNSYMEVVGGTISRDATWKDTLPLKILGSLTVKGTDGVDSLTTLTLDPGAELRFGLYLQFIIGGTSGDPGALMAVGTAENQIRFTSSAATPAPGNWYGILFSTTAEDSSIMDYCIVEYAGYGGNGGVKTYYSSPTIQNSLIQNNSTYGIYNYYGSPTVSNTTINGNGTYGIYVKGGSPQILNSIFTGNGSDAIYTQSGSPNITGNSFLLNSGCGVKNITSTLLVAAENNWWGHSTGPLDSSNDTGTGGFYNPTGQGACVSDYVDYAPWSSGSLADTDGDGITDENETTLYGTDPAIFDSDGDGVGDGEELTYWGENWNGDADNDGLINLLDIDSDNDGLTDGEEISQGSDPSAAPVPATILYEDAEDGLTTGWTVYDDDPTGAFVDNVFDAERDNRVIELYGDGLLNGFSLLNDQNQDWDNTDHRIIQWSMKYSEDFVISIAADTTDGLRYLSYTPEEGDALGTGTDIFHGLKSISKDGTWRTYIFDLDYHLKEAQPSNNLTSLLGFYVSGNGRVDDIQTHPNIPTIWDADADNITDNDELQTYGTHPYKADTDGDGINDGDELNFWGNDWNADPDSDGLINILDIDSDNDGVNDGA